MGGGSYMVHTVIRYWESIEKNQVHFYRPRRIMEQKTFLFQPVSWKVWHNNG